MYTYPDAIFSPDATAVYYIEFEMSTRVHTVFSLSKYIPIPGDEITVKHRIDKEVITIHRVVLATGQDEVIARLPRPPWVGHTLIAQATSGDWLFQDQDAQLKWSGHLQYEVIGPCRKAWGKCQPCLTSEDRAWGTRAPEPYSSGFSKQRRVTGNLELLHSIMSRFKVQNPAALYLVDHEHQSIRILAAASKRDEEQAREIGYADAANVLRGGVR